ncbi:MAG: hypothetical protein OXR68_07320 [Alphaproteobacteria bacterium]|nr:hypothetical protein [Alphaproteobacteria bacterium]MDD9920413.1 hypothetical protein [Alphaproteobacteria bacterium]
MNHIETISDERLLPQWAMVLCTLILTAGLMLLTWAMVERHKNRVIPEGEGISKKVVPASYVAVEMLEQEPMIALKSLRVPRSQIQHKPYQARKEPKVKPEQKSTLELVGYVIKSLVKEEVEGFVQKASLLNEVGRHLKEQKY